MTEGGPDDATDAFGPTTSNPRSGQKSFEAQDTGGASEYPDNIVFDQVNVSSYDNVWVHVWIDTNWGGFESSDYIRGYVSIDGGAWTEFFYIYDDTGSSPLPADYTEYTYNVGDTASTVRIKIEMRNSANTEIYYFDDVSITGISGGVPPPPPTENTIEVTETAPVVLDNSSIANTRDVWVELIENAENTIDIEAYYLKPREYENDALDNIYNALFAAADRGVQIRILVDNEKYYDQVGWMETLDNHENITVLGFTSSQTLHSKYMVVDNRVVSIGSTNWSYPALTNNREVNVTLRGENIAGTYTYIFEGGWSLAGGENRGAELWQANWIYPVAHGLGIPENIKPHVDALTDLIDNAENDVVVYVYFYSGTVSALENTLRNAASRGARVKLMVDNDCYAWFSGVLKSLDADPNIYVKAIELPDPPSPPLWKFAHPKFVIVDNRWAYVGSFNWTTSATNRREVGVIFDNLEVAGILGDIFTTDWESEYSFWVNPYGVSIEVSPFRQGDLPGSALQYSVVVKNVGNAKDNFDLTVSDNMGWNVSISPTLIENLPPDENATATLTVNIPAGASAGQSDVVTVTATSQGDNDISTNKNVLALVIDVAQFSPVDDAAVFQDTPDSNYGSETWLEVASQIGGNRRSYLKFDLSQLPENALTLDTDLNLYFYWGSGYTTLRDAGVLIEARAVRNDSWSESTITWNNAPAIEEMIDSVGIGSYGWKTWGVSSFTKQQFENDNIASFVVKFDIENFDTTLRRIRFRSDEYLDNVQQKPYLKVEYFPATYSVEVEASPSQKYSPAGQQASYNIDVTNLGNIDDNYQLSFSSSLNWSIQISPSILENILPGKTKTATLTVTVPDNATPGTVNTVIVTATSLTKSTAQDNTQALTKVVEELEFSPTDDSYVDQANPDLNYGSDPHLEVASMIGGNRRTYMEFDVSTVPENMDIVSSKIYAYFYWGSGFVALRDNDVMIEARAVRDDSWSEATVTWNNAPAVEEILESVQIGTWKNWKWWNIDNYLLEQYGGDKLVSIALKFSVENFDENLRRIRFRSDEYLDNIELRPYLSVWYFPSNVVYGVDVQVDPEAKGGNAGDNLQYTVKVTNLGNIKDSFDLSAQSALGWSVSLTPTYLEDVPPNTTATATLTVTIPNNAQPGEIDNITVTATSRGDNTLSDNAVVRAGISQITTLLSVDDAAVFQDSPNSNYGSETWLEVASAVDNNRRSLLKFDLSSLPAGSEVIRADLNLYFYWGSGFVTLRDAGVLIEARAILDDSWSEATVTWNNAPTLDNLLTAVGIGSYGWKVWDVGNFVAQQFGNDDLASFAIKFDIEDFDTTLRRIRFRSDEYSDNLNQRPYLEVEYFP